MKTVTQTRCYCVWKFGRDLWQSEYKLQLWTKSIWAHGFFNKSEAAWLVKIASHEQPTNNNNYLLLDQMFYLLPALETNPLPIQLVDWLATATYTASDNSRDGRLGMRLTVTPSPSHTHTHTPIPTHPHTHPHTHTHNHHHSCTVMHDKFRWELCNPGLCSRCRRGVLSVCHAKRWEWRTGK